jgi:hypothetical protein
MPEMPPGSVPGKGRTYIEAGLGALTNITNPYQTTYKGFLMLYKIA